MSDTLREHALRAERDALAARLAEVEAERDEAWKFAQERIEKQNVETGKRVDLIHEREAFRAERDRLAQELEDKSHDSAQYHASYVDAVDRMFRFKDERDEAIELLRAVWLGIPPNGTEAFLARFPVKERDGDDS